MFFRKTLTNEISRYIFAEDVLFNDKIVKQYLYFNDIHHFLKLDNKSNHYYEVIDGLQRLYIDIDIKNNTKNFNDEVLELKDHLEDKLSAAIVNIYTSHTTTKQSYHIIVQNYYVNDNVQCRAYIEKLLEDFYLDLKQFIDIRLYNRKQLFRVLGSSKYGIDNTKISWIGSNELKDSLVSYFDTSDNIILEDITDKYHSPDIRYQMRKYHNKQKNKEICSLRNIDNEQSSSI